MKELEARIAELKKYKVATDRLFTNSVVVPEKEYCDLIDNLNKLKDFGIIEKQNKIITTLRKALERIAGIDDLLDDRSECMVVARTALQKAFGEDDNKE